MQAAMNRTFILMALTAWPLDSGRSRSCSGTRWKRRKGIPVESDWLYRKHYAQLQKIMQAPLYERESKLENFHRKLHARAKMRAGHGQLSSDSS